MYLGQVIQVIILINTVLIEVAVLGRAGNSGIGQAIIFKKSKTHGHYGQVIQVIIKSMVWKEL